MGEEGGNGNNVRIMIRSILHDIKIQISNRNNNISDEQKVYDDTALDNPLYNDFEAALIIVYVIIG